MKLSEIIAIKHNIPSGFRVHFEHYGDGFLRSDYYPERDEPSIPFEEEAWKVAEILAKILKGKACNFYVCNAKDWSPVKNYKEREIENR